jgi:hypothetical protein
MSLQALKYHGSGCLSLRMRNVLILKLGIEQRHHPTHFACEQPPRDVFMQSDLSVCVLQATARES